ncbi:MAG: trigger factor [Bacilli bacterium]
MEKKINKLEHCHVEVLVTVDEKTWKDAQNKSFNKFAKDVTVKGFRKGKAPLNLVKEKVDQGKVLDDAINAVLGPIYTDIINNDKIEPYARPQVDVTKVSDTELELKFVIPTKPEVALGEYTGLQIGKETVTVTDEDVMNDIAKTQGEKAMLVTKESAAENGDTVVIDFVGTVDGVPFEGGSATNYELELGSNSFVPGFEDQLVGTKAGEQKDVNITFPENYVENLKGKAAVFAVTVHEVKTKELPELNDEFVKELNIPNVETVEQLKEKRAAELKVTKERDARHSYMHKLIEKIVEGSTIDLPHEIIDSQVESMKKDMLNRLSQSGLNMEQYLSIVGQTEEQLNETMHTQAEHDAKEYFTVQAVGEKENITVSDEDLEFEYAKMSEQYNMKLEDVKKALAQQVEEFRNNVKMNHIDNFLYDNNN